ncbi:hypothetical protein SOPP22_18085 [Shewanella sp. OPT22]|nr:hypothetical protein SOPP22_18085 [Shewanella sp. OPT22]
MNKSNWLLLLIFLSSPTFPSSFYKCTKGDRVVYSQSICPQSFKQSEIAYNNGVTIEKDSDQKVKKTDPLKILLTNTTIPHDKLILLISGEIKRIKQEIRYNDVIKANELQNLARNRFWQETEINDIEYEKDVEKLNKHFDELNKVNKQTIAALESRRQQLEK